MIRNQLLSMRCTRSRLATMLLCMLVMLTGCGDEFIGPPANVPDNRIYFNAVDSTGVTSISSVNPDGSGYRRLITVETGLRIPLLSPPAKGFMAYMLIDSSKTSAGDSSCSCTRRLMLARVDGSNSRELAAGKLNYGQYSLSPMGDWVAFALEDGGLNIVSTAGGPARPLPVTGETFDFSADGRNLAVSGYGGLSIVDVATGTLRNVISVDRAPTGSYQAPAWSPVATNVVAFKAAYGSSVHWYSADINGGEIRLLHRYDQATSTTWGPYTIAWSRDGSQIAFIQEEELWVMNADGGDARRLASSIFGSIQWSADNASIVCNGRSPTGLYLIDVATSARRQLAPYLQGSIFGFQSR